MLKRLLLALLLLLGVATAAQAASPRALLTAAIFDDADKTAVLAGIDAAGRAATTTLAHAPRDSEARLVKAMAVGYRATLERSRQGAMAARTEIEAVVAAEPHNPDAQIAVAGWHLDAIASAGALPARLVLGASRDAGLAALDRAVALRPDHAMYPALAALMRIRLDPRDIARARSLAEAAVAAEATTPLDRLLRQRAAALLEPLRAGDGKRASALAVRLLPLGQVKR
ncbi:hypothetical protein ACMT1E_12250 [Sphingomonas flavalba]|uniref:hypothetical protein n=1 Tax=Sphingomonas flavalba TaxID=2559804 RepID=UPI0039E0C8DC